MARTTGRGHLHPHRRGPFGVVGRTQSRIRQLHTALRLLVTRHPPVGLRPRHGQRTRASSASNSPSSVATTPPLTPPSACGRRRPTAPASRSPWSTVETPPSTATAPCLLYGYGAYEHSVDPVFSTFRLSLLERGFVFAIAHVRGGGELGRSWYEEGKLLAKPNTFSDFVACARHLVDIGWTQPRTHRGQGWLGRGPAHRGRRQSRPRRLPGHGGRGALRRLPDHHARRDAPPHRHRVGGMGQPGRRSRGVPRHEVVQPLRQRPPGPLPGDVGDRRARGSPCRLLGTDQMGAEAARRRRCQRVL